VRSLLVVVLAPSLDNDRCPLQAVEDLTVEQLIPELAIEALAIAVLPGLPGSMNSVFEPISAS
jgi:hypothetical protein